MTPPSSPRADLPVRLRGEIRGDFTNLPTPALQKEALRYLTRLKQHPRLGTPLTKHPTMGDLSDCRKIYFDERPGPPRWRIVYRLLPNEVHPVSVDVICIGPRQDGAVYSSATLRLGRERS